MIDQSHFSIDRRALLAATLAAPLAPSAQLFAAPAGTPRLLVVFLRGAYDSCSVIAPISSSLYAETRPTLAFGKPGSGTGAALGLSAEWGLNPVLGTSLMPFWQRGELAFVPFAGTPDMSRSHFETQDTIELGLPLTASRAGASGFMNRLAAELNGVSPVAFGAQLPLIFRGKVPVSNLSPSSAGGTGDGRRDAMIARMYAADKTLGVALNNDIKVKQEVSASLANEMITSGRKAISSNDFEGNARRIGRIMRGATNLAFVDVGGWDTHVGQRSGLDFRLNELSKGLAGFADEIGPAEWRNTTVVVISEFGRTLRENGAHGTDHGHGTAFWFLGGGVKGKRIAGEQVKVTEATLNQGRDLPVLNEVRSVLGGLFKRLYGLDATRLGRIFPGAAPLDLQLV